MALVFTAPAAVASPIRDGDVGVVVTVDLGGALVYGVDVENAVWEIHKPWNSSASLAPGAGDLPQSFTADVPGRYLVKGVMDDLIGPDPTIIFSALFEVESAYVKGHATPAATETDEANLPSNEGWGVEMGERIARLVNSAYGFRQTAMGLNTTGGLIPRGTPVVVAQPPWAAWLGPTGVAVGTPPDWLGQIIPYDGTGSVPGVSGVADEDIADGDRGYVQLVGPMILDTSAFSPGDLLYVDNAGLLSVTPGDFPAPVGFVAVVGLATGAAPGILVIVHNRPSHSQFDWPVPVICRAAEGAIYADGGTNDITVYETEMLTPGGSPRWNVRRFECVTAGHNLAMTWHVMVHETTASLNQKRTTQTAIVVPYRLDDAGGSVTVTVFESADPGATSVVKVGSTVSSAREEVMFTWAELTTLDLKGDVGAAFPQFLEIRVDVTLAAVSDTAYVGDASVMWGR